VIFINGDYEGVRGQITELESDGPCVNATVRLLVGAEYVDIPGFPIEDLAKVN